jgi:tetratricopeptide (TPR) repeat protein
MDGQIETEGNRSKLTIELNSLEKRLTSTSLLVAAVMLFQLVLFLYYPSLKGGFIFDDFHGIVHNDDLHSPVDLTSFFGDHKSSIEFDRRPVSGIVMMLNYQLTGPSPAAFRLVNIILHFFIAVSWFILLRQLAVEFSSRIPSLFALTCSILWLVHPLATSATSYCYQRIEMLFAFFLIWSLFFFVRSRSSSCPGLLLIASFLCAVACALSKEIGLAVLPSLAIVHLSLARQKGSNQKFSVSKIHYGGFYLGMIVVFIALGIWFSTGVRMTELSGGELATPWGYFKYESFVLIRYLFLVIWPHPLIFFSAPGEVPTFVKAFPAIAALTGFFSYFIWKGFRKPWLWIVTGVFLSVLGPTSSFFPIHHEPEVDFRMYLPMMATIVLIVGWGGPLLARSIPSMPVLVGVLASATFALGFGTWKRNQVYGSVEQVWLSVLAHEPSNEKALDNLGYWYLEEDRFGEARACGMKLLEMNPEQSKFGHLGLGLKLVGRVELEEGNYKRAQTIFERLEAFSDDSKVFGIELCRAYLGLGEVSQAREILTEKGLSPSSQDLRVKAIWAEIFEIANEEEEFQRLMTELTSEERSLVDELRLDLFRK